MEVNTSVFEEQPVPFWNIIALIFTDLDFVIVFGIFWEHRTITKYTSSFKHNFR